MSQTSSDRATICCCKFRSRQRKQQQHQNEQQQKQQQQQRLYKTKARKIAVRILLVLLLMLLLLLKLSATALSSSTDIRFGDNRKPRECTSIDVRNECRALEDLYGCTVIKGFLIIVLLPKITYNNNSREICDFRNFQFTRLRTIRDMFPSLTVIRGKRLFLNYALGISGMPDLELVEFKSLVAIQRGHVYIGSCPKLCYLNKINWDRLTLAPGENHIFPDEEANCPAMADCKGCDSGYCWSNFVCQKFENTNMANYVQGLHQCHAQCLGGCFDRSNSNEACVVCRGLTDHGACVEKCPEDKFVFESHQRCYTKEECNGAFKAFTHGSKCVEECPYRYKPNAQHTECVACSANESCWKTCNPQFFNDVIIINTLDDADQIAGCQIVNGSLFIAIRSMINENDLQTSLAELREIKGYLKVTKSPHLKSLKFLHNLEKISGSPLENDIYALIIYDNAKLQELWKAPKLVMERGSMYIHSNNKLCNRILRQFHDSVEHDQSKDSLQTSDQEVLCDPAKLMLEIQVLSHKAIKYSWRKEQTSEEIEIINRPVPGDQKFTEDFTELDENICTRINWQRRLVFRSELQDNGTHYSFIIKDLLPNTQYACLIKTFGGDQERNAQSLLKLIRTQPDKPTAPALNVLKRTDNSLTLNLVHRSNDESVVDYYRLEVYEHPDKRELLDQRNYCDHPALLYQSDGNGRTNEDYDDCCERLEEEAEDDIFIANIKAKFDCSLDKPRNCGYADPDDEAGWQDEVLHPLRSLRLGPNETTYTLHALEHFRLYTFQLQACSSAVGCGSFVTLSERTNYSATGDKLEDLRACRIAAAKEFHIHFTEPNRPNGFIVSYVIHFRYYLPQTDSFESHLKCVTRLQHAKADYRYIAQLNSSDFNEVAVRLHSLAGDALSHWVRVTECDSDSPAEVTQIANNAADTDQSRVAGGINYFLLFFLLGAGGTGLWICYKRRYWRHLLRLRRFCFHPSQWRSAIMPDTLVEDREVLVNGFEAVHFRNNTED